MTDPAADIPVAIDRVDRVRGDGDGVRLRLAGRWLAPGDPADIEPLLVVSLHGRRHRFPADRRTDHQAELSDGAWETTFTLPSWAEPRRYGQAALWLGDAVVPVPPAGMATPRVERRRPPAEAATAPPSYPRLPAPPPLGEATPWPPEPTPPGPFSGSPDREPPAQPVFDSGRTGPLAELLFKESVSALHAELEQRAGEVARLRGALADTRAELESRTPKQAALEAAHVELRAQLQELMAAATDQRQELEQRLDGLQERVSESERRRAEAESERDRARQELEAERGRSREELEAERRRAENDRRTEQERLERERETERAQARRELEAELSSAQRQRTVEFTALREQLAAANVSRDAAVSEMAGLQSELERLGTELAVTREQLEARGGNLGEAEQLLAEARALTEELRGQTSH